MASTNEPVRLIAPASLLVKNKPIKEDEIFGSVLLHLQLPPLAKFIASAQGYPAQLFLCPVPPIEDP
jgi:hypothetical protein